MPGTKEKFRTINDRKSSTVIRKGSKSDKDYLEGKNETRDNIKGVRASAKIKNKIQRLGGAIQATVRAELKAKKKVKK